MCGIAGFVGVGERSDLVAMTDALAHRGPDGEGFYVDAARGVHLGHRRLSILDIEGGHQPMWNEDQSVAIVFNGEIYNHAELRVHLEGKGHTFRSDHSDTEVLVHGYEEWEADLPARLNGMFAFAIYDMRKCRLFLARDRMGEKPLYYAQQGGMFAFASELSALFGHRRLAREINPLSLQKFFAYGYLPAPNAFYRGCAKLPAGHHLVLDVASGRTEVRRYFRFSLDADEGMGARGEDALADELGHLIRQAAGRRLISDVPLGIFLSGGIDSSSVLLGAAQSSRGSELKTFTVAFTEPSYDESGYAREVATHISTLHHEETLDMEVARGLIPDVLGRLDEPLGDPSILPTYLLSRMTRKHVTVALSGDGGDELFAGYDPFAALGPAQWYSRLVPAPLHRAARRLADLLPISTANMSLDFKIRRALTGLSYPPALWNPVWMSSIEPRDLPEVFESPVSAEEVYSEAIDVWNRAAGKSLVDRSLEFFTNLYLPDNILAKVDRAAMMVSLESRAVFLDNDVVDFCRRLPSRFKYRNGERKYLLKRAVASSLPASVTGRKKKGFGIPIARWLREVPAVPPLATVRGVRMNTVERLWNEHRAQGADHRLFLWSWLSLQCIIANAGSHSG